MRPHRPTRLHDVDLRRQHLTDHHQATGRATRPGTGGGDTRWARLYPARDLPGPRRMPAGRAHGSEPLLLRTALVTDGKRAAWAAGNHLDIHRDRVALHDPVCAADEGDGLRAPTGGAGEDGHAEDGH